MSGSRCIRRRHCHGNNDLQNLPAPVPDHILSHLTRDEPSFRASGSYGFERTTGRDAPAVLAPYVERYSRRNASNPGPQGCEYPWFVYGINCFKLHETGIVEAYQRNDIDAIRLIAQNLTPRNELIATAPGTFCAYRAVYIRSQEMWQVLSEAGCRLLRPHVLWVHDTSTVPRQQKWTAVVSLLKSIPYPDQDAKSDALVSLLVTIIDPDQFSDNELLLRLQQDLDGELRNVTTLRELDHEGLEVDDFPQVFNYLRQTIPNFEIL